MDASDWMYIGEGGKHAVFGYSSCGADEKWIGRALRIPKDTLRAAPSDAATDTSFNENEISAVDNASLYYIREVVKPLLGHYVEVPEVILLDWEFVAALRDQTISAGVIPSSRLHQWTEAKRDTFNVGPIPAAHVLWNYRYIQSDSPCISVEIKPKAGYTAFSPLVDSKHRVKFFKTRFNILQRLHCDGHIIKGWDGNKDSKVQQSLYNPLDLFSGEASKVKRALDHLVATPQNNMRVWIEDTLSPGTETLDQDESVYERGLGMLLPSECDRRDPCVSARTEFFEALMTCIALILVKEELLQRLLRLQQLDVVDADGAILIYKRLRGLCGDEADELIDSSSPLDEGQETEEDHVLQKSPFQKPLNSLALTSLLHEIGVFSARLHGPSRPTPADMDEANEACKSYVTSLTQDECVYLLKNWLLSLAISDASFFLVLRPNLSLDDSEDFRGIIPKDTETTGVSDCIVRCQSQSSPGIVIANNRAVAYTLKVVDCGRKPANKLRQRQDKEEPIRLYKEEGEQTVKATEYIP